MNVFITTSSFGKYDEKPIKLLEEAGFSYTLNPFGRKLKKEEFLELIGDSVGVIAGTELIDEEVLKKSKNVKVISRCGVGLDNVDLKAAERLSIKVENTPDSVTNAVAELTVGLILSLLRKINIADKELKSGTWNKIMGNLLQGKKVGVIGFGRIGGKVGELLNAFGATINYCDLEEKNCSFASNMAIEALCRWSDIITIHVYGHSKGHHLLCEKEFSYIKQGTWIVNCSRGGIVNEKVLYEALSYGKIAGAAVDVFEEEPYSGPLSELGNVILTPHIGSYAKEARIEMEIESVNNLLKHFKENKK